MEHPHYLPTSTHAMFSRIIERLDTQDRLFLEHRREIKESIASFQINLNSTDIRVDSLENDQWKQRGFLAAIALGVPLIWGWITNKS